MQNVSEESDGTELRLGYRYERWWSEPSPAFAGGPTPRSPGATPSSTTTTTACARSTAGGRYEPGAGFNLELGALAAYRLTQRWQVLAGLGVTRWSSGVRGSPVVDADWQPHAMLGLMYGFKPDQPSEWDRRPLIVRLSYGQSTDCDLMPILGGMHRRQHAGRHQHRALDVGQILVERVNNWPLDIAGFIGFLKHEERGLQEDFWQINAYLKPYYYFGPWWRERLRTRFGFGARHRLREPHPLHRAARPGAARARHLEAAALPRPDDRHQHRRPIQRARAARDLRRHRCLAPLGDLRLRAPVQQRGRRLELHLRLRRDGILTSTDRSWSISNGLVR